MRGNQGELILYRTEKESAMSDEMRDEKELCGFHLPEEAKSRLERLGTHLAFLRRLARPRMAGDDPPSLDREHLSSCLELLAEQVDHVLSQASCPAHRTAVAEAPKAPEETHDASSSSPEALETKTEAYPDTDNNIQGEPFVFGVTMDQLDTLDRLIQTISAHGDVVSASDMADFADHTLPMVGHAIFDGATAVRDILDQVEAQLLPKAARPRSGVGDDRVVYAAGNAPAAADHPSSPVQSPYWPQAHAGQPGRLRLH